MRATYEYDSKNNCIEITEIPYSTTCEAIIGKIMELVKANKLKEISDARDETGLNGFKLTIDLKRGTDPDQLMLKLFKLTPLEDSFSCNFNILIKNSPMVLGVKDILKHWVEFRTECISNSLKFDKDRKSEKLHLLTGLKKILMDIDKAIAIIRHTEREEDVVPNLMAGFEIDKIQAEYVAEIKLRNLNREYILNRTAEIEKLIDEIDKIAKTLASNREIRKLIISQLTAIAKKYGKDRKTRLIHTDDIEVYSEEKTIEDYPLTIFVTKEGYLKKVSATSLKFTTTEHKLKEDDKIVQTIETTNKSEILFFTNKCEVYKMRTHEIADGKVSTMGEYMPGLLGLSGEEKILYTVVTTDYKGFMLFSFENGKIAKVSLESYATKTNRKKLIGAYSDKAAVSDIKFLAADREIVCYADNNKVLAVNTEKIALKSTKSTQGVQVLKLTKKGARMVRVSVAEESGIENLKYYSTKNIPAVGSFLKKDDTANRQLSLFED